MRSVLLTLALGLAACHSQSEVGLPTVHAGQMRLVAADPAPWKPAPAYEEIRGPWRVAHGGFEDETAIGGEGADPFVGKVTTTAAVPTPVVSAPPPAGPTLPVPARRAQTELRPVGASTGKSTAELARDHFLDYPTHVRADRVTLYVPPALAGAVRLMGQQVDRSRPARQQAVGAARLVLRELTLEGDRVVLRVREDGLEDVQITARGGVEFVSNVRGNILRERGLKSLLITNDQVVPIP